MIPVDFEGSNVYLRKPENMTDEQCMGIKAWVGTDDAGFLCFITAWQPNKEDLEALNMGKPVYIKTLAVKLPPMSVFTVDEWGKPNEDI